MVKDVSRVGSQPTHKTHSPMKKGLIQSRVVRALPCKHPNSLESIRNALDMRNIPSCTRCQKKITDFIVEGDSQDTIDVKARLKDAYLIRQYEADYIPFCVVAATCVAAGFFMREGLSYAGII